MLSHLVGAANRADIRRLCQLGEENAELRARLDKQQAAIFCEALVTRDATIQELRRALVRQVSREPSTPDEHSAVLHHLIADLERRLALETRRCTVGKRKGCHVGRPLSTDES